MNQEQRNPAQAELDAYNRAFWQLGLQWAWDGPTFSELSSIASPAERLACYLAVHHPHMLRAYDPQFLADAVEAKKLAFTPDAAGDSSRTQVQLCNWAAVCTAVTGA